MTEIEVTISKPVVEALFEHDYKFKSGLNILTLEQAMDLEQVAWTCYQTGGGTALARGYAALSRHLAYAIECTRSIQQVEDEIRTVLDGKWDDEDAIEKHVQLMVHRSWDRTEALKVINRVRGHQ